MNKLKSVLTWMLLLAASHVLGINVTVAPIEIEAGKTAQLIINLSNTETNLTAYQMFLCLPEGVTVQKKSNGKYAYTLNSSRHDGAFTVSVKDAEDGSVLISCFSADKDVITGTSGELIRLPLEVASTVTSSLQGSLKNMEFSDVNANPHKPADVTFNLTIKSVQPVTITADNKTMTYGDNVPTLTYRSSGATLNGTPKLSTTATKNSPVGTYPIKVEKGTVTNEQVTYVDGTLTISKAPLTVGVQNVTITEGDAIPSFTLTYSGFRNGDTESKAFTTKPKATTTATSSSKPGTYTITVSGGVATNYALTYAQGTLTIKKKDTSESWTNLVVNSNLEGNDVSSFYSRENMAVKDEIVPATIVNGAGKDGSRGIVIHSVDNPSIDWNTQFFVRLSQSLPAGTKYRLSFDHKASRDAYVTMESQAEPSIYIWIIDKDLSMNTSWQHYESEGTVTEDQSTNEKMMHTLAFNLTHNKTATTFYLDNIVFEIDQTQVEQPITVTADNKSMTYGDDVPTLTYKSSGATLNGTPKLSTTATKTSPVGTYPIKVEKGTVKNEQVTFVEGTLTISKAPLTVGVQNVTITEGDAIPSFTLTYSGFRNGDTESTAFTTKPKATTTATSTSKPGTYTITVSGGNAKNYSLTYTRGTLTIKKKETSESWTNLVVNSNLEGNDVSSFYSRENMAVKDEIVPATIVNGAGKDGSRGIVIHSVDNPSIDWNTQFFVRLSQSLPAGTKYRLSFDHKASRDAYVTMESQAEPSIYIWIIDKDLSMNTSWQHYESEGTVTEDQSTNEKMMRTLAFNLTHNKTATTFYLDNIVFEIDPTTDIKTVNTGDQRNDAIFNLSGQRLSKPQKGINIIGGKKVMVK